MIQNPYALDADGNLVSTDEAVKRQDYYCVTCKGRMRLAGGEGTQMQLHFRHIDTNVEHSGETFLHDYAKHLIAQQIQNAETFEIGYHVPLICCKEDCPINKHDCNQDRVVTFNIKDYYDNIKVEGTFKEFRADILLSSRRFEDRPLFIEVAVTHESEEGKKNSHIRIIEVIIPPDFDCTKLSFTELTENRQGHQYKDGIQVKFYNFEKVDNLVSEKPFGEKQFKTIVYREDGSTTIWDLNCSDYGRKVCKDSIKEIHFAIEKENFKWTAAKAVASLNGIPCKDCRLCSNQFFSSWSSMHKCNHTRQVIKQGREAVHCKQYKFSEFEALKWALKIKEYAYFVVDKDGNYVWPIDVQAEYEKAEDDFEEVMYELYEEEVKSRELEEENRTSEEYTDPEEEYSVYEEVNSGNLEKKIRDFKEEIKVYEE